MQNVIGYIRVSTADQSSSLDVQKDRINQYCIYKNFNLIQIFIDEDISGFTEFKKRPAGKEATIALNSPDINTIIAVKPDRLFRNTMDGIITTQLWNTQNIDLHIIDMGGDSSISTKTAIGKFIFTTLISMSQFERDITGERTKAVIQHKIKNGQTHSHSILGFNNIDSKLQINPQEMAIVKTIFGMKNTSSAESIAKHLNSNNLKSKTGKNFLPSTIRYILKNPIYASHL